MTTNIKHLVSKKKRRYKEDGFDLDLAYIKPNIIAMGFPSENLEGMYRNHFEDVIRFLNFKHKDKYKVYNLCSEKEYDESKFNYRVARFGFDDHNAPPFNLIESCCIDMDQWLSADEDNVAIVHCKAGKGRTGVMICSYLLYKKMFVDSEKAMQHYAKARTENEKGVTIPSQRRYITYFGYYVRHSLGSNPKTRYSMSTVLLKSITLVGVPTYNSGTCSPSFVIYQTRVAIFKSKTYEINKSESTPIVLMLDRPIPICGDVKIDFFHKEIFKKERMFVFWFNTFFLEHGITLKYPDGGGIKTGKDNNGEEYRTYTLDQSELDKANKDKKHKFFPKGFQVLLTFSVPSNIYSTDEASPNSPAGNDCFSPQQANSLPAKCTTKPIRSTNNDLSEDMKTMSLKQLATLHPPKGTSSNRKGPSPVCIKKLQTAERSPIPYSTSDSNLVASSVSKSDQDLSCELLSDDDDEEPEMVL